MWLWLIYHDIVSNDMLLTNIQVMLYYVAYVHNGLLISGMAVLCGSRSRSAMVPCSRPPASHKGAMATAAKHAGQRSPCL